MSLECKHDINYEIENFQNDTYSYKDNLQNKF